VIRTHCHAPANDARQSQHFGLVYIVCDERPAAVLAPYQPLALKDRKRVADGDTADAELPCEVQLLGQLRSGRKFSVSDALP
jgi:hypothetical protein